MCQRRLDGPEGLAVASQEGVALIDEFQCLVEIAAGDGEHDAAA